MSENQQIALLAQINGSLRQITISLRSILNDTTLRIINEIRFAANVITKANLTGVRPQNTTLGKELGIKTQTDLFPKLSQLFAPLVAPATPPPLSAAFLSKIGQIPGFGQGGGVNMGIMPSMGDLSFKSLLQPVAAIKAAFVSMGPIMKKMGTGLKTTFQGAGQQILSAFSPMQLLFQILQPLIGAFLEPLEMLEPLMSSWGTILSQLLIPIVMALMDVLMPFTPLLQVLVEAFMPLIEIFPMLAQFLIPIIELIVGLLVPGLKLIQLGLKIIMDPLNTVILIFAQVGSVISGALLIIPNKLTEFLGWVTGMWDSLWTGIREKIKGLGTMITNAWKDMMDGFFTKIKDKFNIFKGGGLDNNPDTWW